MAAMPHQNRPDQNREPIGALLTRRRLELGYSQLRVAERLCAVAGATTISRHEVSRWERQERIPGGFWLRWLSEVLEVPHERLELAAAVARGGAVTPVTRGAPDHHRLWRPPRAADLLDELDQASCQDLRELAHAWLAGPPEPEPMPFAGSGVRQLPAITETLDGLATRLAALRQLDDMVGGVDLAGVVDRELRGAIEALRPIRGGGQRHRALQLVAGYAQLAGWVFADTDDPAAARRRYRVALRAAAATGDRPLAGHVLGALSHLSLATGDPFEALLLARTGLAGATGEASPLTLALLHHRVALAAARCGERRTAHAALARADQAAARSRRGELPADRVWAPPASAGGPEPGWLYWLDAAELAAMRGRCLAVLGRPLRAARLLAAPRRAGPRTAAVYGVWLARSYLELGEVEQASRTALRAMRAAVRAGSVRAATGLRQLHPLLLRHRDLPAVRAYEQRLRHWIEYLPAGGWRPRAGAA